MEESRIKAIIEIVGIKIDSENVKDKSLAKKFDREFWNKLKELDPNGEEKEYLDKELENKRILYRKTTSTNEKEKTDSTVKADTTEILNPEILEASNLLANRPEGDIYQLIATHAISPSKLYFSDGRMRLSTESMTRTEGGDNLGKRIFMRWSVSFHDFICQSSGEGQELRTKIVAALIGKQGGATALIAGVMVATFGVSPLLATLIATLLIRCIVSPTADELCSSWRKFNEQAPNPVALKPHQQ